MNAAAVFLWYKPHRFLKPVRFVIPVPNFFEIKLCFGKFTFEIFDGSSVHFFVDRKNIFKVEFYRLFFCIDFHLRQKLIVAQ